MAKLGALLLIGLLSANAMAIPEGPGYLTQWQNVILPFYQQTGQGGQMTAFDGVKISYRLFANPNAKAGIVIFPGRSEAAAQYAEVISDLYAQGYAIFIIDHRGQGESQRLLPAPNDQIGYVQNFSDYVADVDQFVKEVVQPAAKAAGIEKLHLLAHSMGGAIGLRYLEQAPNTFASAVFSSPMIQVNTAPIPYPIALAVITGATKLGKGEDYAPTQAPYDQNSPFDQNVWTHSQDRFAMSKDLVADYLSEGLGNLGVGGASYQWTEQALLAYGQINADAGKINTPMVILEAGDDHYVTASAEDAFCAQTQEIPCQVITQGFEKSYHSLLMETDDVRDAALKDAVNWFSQN